MHHLTSPTYLKMTESTMEEKSIHLVIHALMTLNYTIVLSRLGPEHLKPPSYRPLNYRGAVPDLPESCCVELGQPTTAAAKTERLVGWRSMR